MLTCMKLVIVGLSVSSSWGNAHPTLWRGLWRALARRGHQVIFFEHDTPWYAGNIGTLHGHREAITMLGARPTGRSVAFRPDAAVTT